MFRGVHRPLLGSCWDKNLLVLCKSCCEKLRGLQRNDHGMVCPINVITFCYQNNFFFFCIPHCVRRAWKQGSGDTSCHEFLLVVTVSGDSAEFRFPALCTTLYNSLFRWQRHLWVPYEIVYRISHCMGPGLYFLTYFAFWRPHWTIFFFIRRMQDLRTQQTWKTMFLPTPACALF
jgi:hypothetical protein